MTRRIAIVGGGVVGASIAWHLAVRQAGGIVLYERERLGAGTTWHSAGNITWKPTPDSDAPIAYLLALIERLQRETGQDTGWLATGRLFLSLSDTYSRRLEQYHADAVVRWPASVMLEPAEAARRHPLLDAGTVQGAWFNPQSGRLSPAGLLAAYVRGARQRGVQVLENRPVTRVVLGDRGVVGVETDEGVARADCVVIASGLWSRQLLARSQLALAHGVCEHFYVIARPTPALQRMTPAFSCPEALIYGREEVGNFLVGFFDRDAKVVDVNTLPDPFAFAQLPDDWAQVAQYFEAAARCFPALRDAPVLRFVNGPESFTADGAPLVGPVKDVPGLYVACAMNSAGVTYSGMVGHNTADWLCGVEPRFRVFDTVPDRFGPPGADPAWVDAQMPHAPSRFYTSHLMSAPG